MKTAHGCVPTLLVAASFLMMGAAPMDKPLLQVQNGFMEEVAPGATLPVGYYLFGSGLAEMDRTVTFEGKPSIKVLLRGMPEGIGIIQAVPSTVPEGKICRFRVRVRTHGLNGKAYLFIYRYPMPDSGFMSAQQLSGTHDWTTIEALVPSKKGGDSFQVRMMVEGTMGRVWLANFEATVEEKP